MYAYVAYLQKTGEPNEAASLTSEVSADQAVKALFSKYYRPRRWIDYASRAVLYWVAGPIALANLTLMVACALLASTAVRIRRPRENVRWSPAAKWAFFIAVTILVVALIASFAQANNDYLNSMMGGGLSGGSSAPTDEAINSSIEGLIGLTDERLSNMVSYLTLFGISLSVGLDTDLLSNIKSQRRFTHGQYSCGLRSA